MLPAVAIAAAFAVGILLGLGHSHSYGMTHRFFPAWMVAAVFLLIILGCALAWRDFVWASATVSLVVRIGLGILAGCIADQLPDSRSSELCKLF
jgi:hypothetical protein